MQKEVLVNVDMTIGAHIVLGGTIATTIVGRGETKEIMATMETNPIIGPLTITMLDNHQ